MKRSVLWASSLLTLAAACGGRSTDVLDDEPPDEPTSGVGGGQGMGGSGGGQGMGGSGGGQATAGSGGAQGLAGAGGTGGASSGTKPFGEDQPCLSDLDCAGYEASFCDFIVSNTCLVRGCSLAPDSCFAGKQCCDLSAFGLPTLCTPTGACLD